MKIKIYIILTTVLALFSLTAQASWVCNVANKKGQHWTFTAPTEDGARGMAKHVCDANSFNPANCAPACFNNGFAGGRWHCSVSNLRNQHWSYFAPSRAQSWALAKHACDANSINPGNCRPSCVPE